MLETSSAFATPGTRTRNEVIRLISDSATGRMVTAGEEQRVLARLTADPDLSATIADLYAAGMLKALLERVGKPAYRRDLLRLLGARLNPAARDLVEPLIQDLSVNAKDRHGLQIQYNLGRLGVSGPVAPFNRGAYSDLVSKDSLAPFTGSGATGVNPSQRGFMDWARVGRKMISQNINPIGPLGAYLATLTADQRRRQAELLIRQPISTNFEQSYAGQLPSRLQVIRAAAIANRVEPELIAAILLAEQRDQCVTQDARDFLGAFVFTKDTSIGLGQVKGTTAKRNDLFADMLTRQPMKFAASTARASLNPAQMARLLASDEVNITAVARYLRILIDGGMRHTVASLPNTKAAFPSFDPVAYADPPTTWSTDNIAVLGMCYTSKAWTDKLRSAGWGRFMLEAFHDVKSAALF